MAAVGALAQHYLRLPGFEDVPSGLRAAVIGAPRQRSEKWLASPGQDSGGARLPPGIAASPLMDSCWLPLLRCSAWGAN